ncbi:MAG: hypothetical protein ABFC24_04395 [Methanoregulaceae archaeon]
MRTSLKGVRAGFTGSDRPGRVTASASRRLRGRIALSSPEIIEEIAESDLLE